jgi:hypothetical protein
VQQLAGTKVWTICHAAARDSSLSEAEQAQLAEVEANHPKGCRNPAPRQLGKMRCESLKMNTGDILYLPKGKQTTIVPRSGRADWACTTGTVHFAKTAEDDFSAHATFGIGTQSFTWQKKLEASCVSLKLPICPEVHTYLESLKQTAFGVWLYQLATPDRVGYTPNMTKYNTTWPSQNLTSLPRNHKRKLLAIGKVPMPVQFNESYEGHELWRHYLSQMVAYIGPSTEVDLLERHRMDIDSAWPDTILSCLDCKRWDPQRSCDCNSGCDDSKLMNSSE